MSRRKKKVFVLDTNVVLHDSTCLHQFEEHDIIVPISVLEEIDHFKKGNDIINYHAREFSRSLDSLGGTDLFYGGVAIGTGHGKISVKLDQSFHEDLSLSFSADKRDHRILNCAYRFSKENPGQPVVLVSKDTNLRLKAKAVGLQAEDYTTDHVQDMSQLYSGNRIEENVSEKAIEGLYHEPFDIALEALDDRTPLVGNEFLILRNGKKSALARFDPLSQRIRRVDKVSAYGITPRNAEQTFALAALLNPDIQLVTLSGKAGTGKTLLALAAALEQRHQYRQVFMARPIVPLSNKDIGYLPGDISSKLDPYMQPLHDNLGVIQNQFAETNPQNKKIREMLDSEKLKISPLSYIRGRSIVKVFFIIDEAQNLTPHEVKTIITRAGDNTKIVLTGDIFQIDHPYLDAQSNGLSYLIDKMRGRKLYAHVNLMKGERSELAELASNIL
ncbi:MAG: DUF2075 domain-containing protein [Chitinivibrionales bacterium]|nr:DUF2075 domain-containing protein [Chitinivibrionales bacterium]MBD3358907.1 DUF2075 domain-containing protein [Chitinivibrionales bacterium]